MCSWWTYGQVPPDVYRTTFESSDGRTSDAVVRDGFFAWQSDIDDIDVFDVFDEPLWLTLYDADGDKIDRLNANRHPFG